MEELNNRQIVLLSMLVSFVVSIATGIITVAMLEEAPQTVTQTVNRVVERTIERVVTSTSTPEKPKQAPVSTVTKEVTVFAKEEDLIVSAVEKNQPRLALIYSSTASTGTPPIAAGFVVSRDGVIAAPKGRLLSDMLLLDKTYKVSVSGVTYEASPMTSRGYDGPVAFLKMRSVGAGETFDAVSFGRQGGSKVGQSVIILTPFDIGIQKTSITKLDMREAVGTSTPATLIAIEVLPRLTNEYIGGLAVNLDGQAVGIVVWSPEYDKTVVYPSSLLFDLVGASSETSALMKTDGTNS
jgi:hypothetical protein